ncbi:WXG100 family type VII secretion target [Streptomyces sp. NBC_00250]|uniref:hypothetical protein n=1 Tax=Streptomyces sp. NBC_00250 TaxID=2903641 RepID=UPI002E2819E6|nr:hypothetical protein [Streptomyces sp. NBC_00250]
MRPAEGGGGGGTNFAGMEHQQMLAWLDEASSYYVRDAADRLKSVSEQLATIATDLRVSMKSMDWEGEAEKAFVEWATEVANSTTHLSDYSERGASRMADNAAAIASAQSAMPRYTSQANAKENLDAALKYRNDPDSQTIARNARSSMATSDDPAAIAAKEEANKQAAAAEMYRLSDTYKWSSFYMKNDQPPTFPPPPGAFVPEERDVRGGESTYIGSPSQSERRSTGTDTGTSTVDTTRPQQDTRPAQDTNTVPPKGDPTGPTHVVRPEVRPDAPVDLGIDSVDTKTPPTTGPTTQTPGSPPPITKPDGSTPPFVTTGMPPLPSKGGPGLPPPTGPVTGGMRNPMNPGGPRGLPTGPGPLGGTREGISGGKAVPHTGRPQTGLPRSTVIGTEQGGRNGMGMGRPMGGGMGGPMGGMGAGQNGITGGRRLAGESGGVVGGKAQRAGATGGAGRPFTPGGSGLVRGGSTQAGDREETNGERPDYLVEDEETWQQGRRVAPPVID